MNILALEGSHVISDYHVNFPNARSETEQKQNIKSNLFLKLIMLYSSKTVLSPSTISPINQSSNFDKDQLFGQDEFTSHMFVRIRK